MVRTLLRLVLAFVIGAICGVTVNWLGFTNPLAQVAAGCAGYMAIDWLIPSRMKYWESEVVGHPGFDKAPADVPDR